MKAGKLKDSIEPLEWLLKNAENLNPSIYIRGVQIYDRLAGSEQDDSLQKHYQHRVIDLIDRREVIFESQAAKQNKEGLLCL